MNILIWTRTILTGVGKGHKVVCHTRVADSDMHRYNTADREQVVPGYGLCSLTGFQFVTEGEFYNV